MGLIDSILNVACVLLWLNWRSVQVTSLDPSAPVSLASTLKKAEVRRGSSWISLATVLALLGLRSLFYWNIGAELNWTPSLELGTITLPFRSDYLWRIVLFSLCSFLLVLGTLYAWLLLISVINRKVSSTEPFQKLVRLHLGWVERLPVVIKLILPILLSTVAWRVGSPGLVQLGIVPAPVSSGHLWQQSVLLGLSSILSWKLLVLALCLLYLFNSYVYTGNSRFWRFVNTTGSNLLWPLRRFPFCIGKFDFSPLLAIALVLFLAHWSSTWLPWLFQKLPF